MVTFIDQHRDTYGVEPICAVLPIAPSTYFLRKAQQQDPTKRSARVQRDAELCAVIQRVWDDNEQVYGPRKVWKQLRRDGHHVARCTVERLMRAMGLKGVTRGRAWTVTTQADPAAPRPADLVDRQFTATRPNQLWIADFTGYVPPAEYEAQYYALASQDGAQRQPHPDSDVDGRAAERPQHFLRPLQNTGGPTELNV